MKRIKSVIVGTAAILVFFIACKKIDVTDIGGDLIPAVDNVTTFDTVLDVITDNFLIQDSSRVLRGESHGWGIIDNDPEFGKTKGEIYLQLTPSSFGNHPFPKKDSLLIIDSVVLTLAYSGYYGDTNSLERMTVHEIDFDALFVNKDIGYKIDTVQIPYVVAPLGGGLVDFKKLNDSVFDAEKRDTLRYTNQLRIHLDKNIANRFLSYDTTNAYKNDSSFRQYFKGLAIRVDEAQSPLKNALAYFNLNDEKTALKFYYRVTNGTDITDTIVTKFGFYTFNSTNSNSLKRTIANNYLANVNNPATNEAKLYLQSAPGSYASVTIPGLSNLSNRVIHRAELLFDVIPSVSDDIYTKPQYLFLDAYDTSKNRWRTIPYDFSYEVNFLNEFGGIPINNGSRYNFNLTRYVQSIVTRKEVNYTLRLSAPYRMHSGEQQGLTFVIPSIITAPLNKPIGAGRVVIGGGNYSESTKRARLRIVYSKI